MQRKQSEVTWSTKLVLRNLERDPLQAMLHEEGYQETSGPQCLQNLPQKMLMLALNSGKLQLGSRDQGASQPTHLTFEKLVLLQCGVLHCFQAKF